MKETTGDHKLFAEERRRNILELVNETKAVTVGEICERYGVSPATARGDLRELQETGQLVRTHGGAIAAVKTGYELDSFQREVHNLKEKKRIGIAALDLVNDGDRIILDTGTTTIELANRLGQRKNLTVATNDLAIAVLLEKFDSVTVIVLGGVVRRNFHCTTGSQQLMALAGLTFDKAFMGVNGFSLEDGATTPDMGQAQSKKAMIGVSKKVILLCDSGKLDAVSFAQFATTDRIDTLVTDRISKSTQSRIEEEGIEVVVASSKEEGDERGKL